MMDIAVQRGISLAFPYRCIITVCLPAIPTWETSLQRTRTANTQWLYVMGLFAWDVCKCSHRYKNTLSDPNAARSCHHKQSEQETSRAATVHSVKSEKCENTPAQQRAHLHTCLQDTASSAPPSLQHFCVRCPFKCRLPTSLQRKHKFCISFYSLRSKLCVAFLLLCGVKKFYHINFSH